MDDQTKKLLKECNVGCKMALQSMTQVEDYLEDSELERVVEDYRREHERVEKETSRLLMEAGASEKDPSPVASASSWITTEMRLMMKGDCHQVAKLMMNGCNMGIQSIAKCQNECRDASREARQIAEGLIHTEEDFMGKMKEFL